MEYVHYSKSPIYRVKSTKQDPVNHRYIKPAGFWFSAESDTSYGWLDWCYDAEYFIQNPVYVTDIELYDDLLTLDCSKGEAVIEDFVRYYSIEYQGFLAIDWEQLAEEYSGIVILNYRRFAYAGWGMNYTWFDAWDYSSGVVWDASAVKNINCRFLRKQLK